MDGSRKQLWVQCPFPAPPPSCPLLTPPAGNYGLAIKLCAQPALIWQGLALERGIWQERNGTEPHGDAEHQGDAGLGWGTRGEQLDVGISPPSPRTNGAGGEAGETEREQMGEGGSKGGKPAWNMAEQGASEALLRGGGCSGRGAAQSPPSTSPAPRAHLRGPQIPGAGARRER